MWRIIDLKKGGFINVNGEMYEVFSNTSTLPSPTSKELEVTIELFKTGEKHPAPGYRLFYQEKANTIRFEIFDRKNSEWKEQKIVKLGF
jgi:hypothetical protein